MTNRYGTHDQEHYERPRRHTRPRTKERPTYDDAVDGVVVTVDRGRYTLLVDGAKVMAMKARPLGRKGVVVGDRVRLGSVVSRIEQDDAGVRGVLRDGESMAGSHVIVTLPPTLAGRLDYAPALPSWRDQLTQRLPGGSVVKVYAAYDEPFWRADGLNGQAASDRGPVKVTFDNSPPSGTPGVLMGFLEGTGTFTLVVSLLLARR